LGGDFLYYRSVLFFYMNGQFNVATLFNIIDLVNIFIGIAWFIAAFLSVYYMFYGGISLILSGGDDKKTSEAMASIRYAIIGFVVTLLSIGFIYLLGNVMGVQVAEYINIERIYTLMMGVGERIFLGPNSASMFDL